MDAKQFYDTKADNAFKVQLLKLKDYKNFLKELSSFQKNILEAQEFNAESGEVLKLYEENGAIGDIYLGLGEDDDFLAIAKALDKLMPGKYLFQDELSNNAKLAWSLSQYCFDEYKEHTKKPKVLVLKDTKEVLIDAETHFLVRDLINKPADDLDPEALAKVVRSLAKKYKADFHELVGDDLIQDGYNGIYTVGRSAESKPRLIELNWGNKKAPLISLVGKGVCFDSGGLNIKPGNSMRLMKKDMGGAAQVIGLANWIMAHKLPVRLQLLIPAVENSISANSFRPGDIITMKNGLTVEVDNTDAEGRLILADALTRACALKPKLIMDFATLTGAARVAVGTEISAMFCTDKDVAEKLISAGEKTKDPICQLPLYPGYNKMLESKVADLVNSPASFYAGAIVAALFLQRFVANNIPWVHFDVMAWNISSTPGKPEGGEAMGIRAAGEFIRHNFV